MQKYTKQDKIKFDKLLWNRDKESEIERNFYKKTEKYLKFIKWIPGLKMVWIWNSISMHSASKDSDIDLLIVTSNNSMWFVRIFVTLIFQVLWVRKNERNHAGRFCLSFFCTIDWLDFSNFSLEKDPYLYFWILYFKPILDYNNTYSLFLEKNKSWTDFSEFNKIIEKNKNYIKYKKNNFKYSFSTEEFSPFKIIDNFIKKIFLPKTLKHYERIWKPYWVIINDNILKFHNWDIRKEISSKLK